MNLHSLGDPLHLLFGVCLSACLFVCLPVCQEYIRELDSNMVQLCCYGCTQFGLLGLLGTPEEAATLFVAITLFLL